MPLLITAENARFFLRERKSGPNILTEKRDPVHITALHIYFASQAPPQPCVNAPPLRHSRPSSGLASTADLNIYGGLDINAGLFLAPPSPGNSSGGRGGQLCGISLDAHIVTFASRGGLPIGGAKNEYIGGGYGGGGGGRGAVGGGGSSTARSSNGTGNGSGGGSGDGGRGRGAQEGSAGGMSQGRV